MTIDPHGISLAEYMAGTAVGHGRARREYETLLADFDLARGLLREIVNEVRVMDANTDSDTYYHARERFKAAVRKAEALLAPPAAPETHRHEFKRDPDMMHAPKERFAPPAAKCKCKTCNGTGRAPFGSGWEPGVGVSDNVCLACDGKGTL